MLFLKSSNQLRIPGSFSRTLTMSPPAVRGGGKRAVASISAPSAQTRDAKTDGYIAKPAFAEQSLEVLTTADDDDAPLPPVDQKHLSDKNFAEFNISAASKRALAEVLKYERCSHVQAAAIPMCQGAGDVIAKAKTGTGKTLAFIIPTIEKVLAHRAPPGKVSALVLSPTRELARQIQTEAHKMLTFHPQLHSMVVYGGVDVKKNLRKLQERMPDILIATPGRCWDLMTQDRADGSRSLLDNVRVMILDEADNLLDMGFRPQLNKILSGLPPPSKRQTYLFSATFPADVKSLADVALKKEHNYVDAVGEDVATHTHVDASSLVVAKPELPLQLLCLLAQHMAQEPEYKVVVFLPTAKLTGFFAETFAAAGMGGVLELHSRLSQTKRDRTSAEFREGSRLVLFSSDVSARGVDYPNVTYVIQLGAPSNREQYIHRAGRTGRAGRAGQCTLLLADFERGFLDRLRDLPITPLQPLVPAAVVRGGGGGAAAVGAKLRADPAGELRRAVRVVTKQQGGQAYQSLLGYYNSHSVIKYRPEQLVAIANEYAAEVLGCDSTPALQARTVGKMGLKGVPGIVLESGNGNTGSGNGRRGGPPPQQQQQQQLQSQQQAYMDADGGDEGHSAPFGRGGQGQGQGGGGGGRGGGRGQGGGGRGGYAGGQQQQRQYHQQSGGQQRPGSAPGGGQREDRRDGGAGVGGSGGRGGAGGRSGRGRDERPDSGRGAKRQRQGGQW